MNSINYYYSSVTLYAEFLPAKQRAKCVILLDVSIVIYIYIKYYI